MSAVKKWIISGVALAVVGAVIFAVGMSVLDWDFWELDSVQYEAKSYARADGEQTDTVSVDLDFPIDVLMGDALSLTYYESENYKVEISESEGAVTIKSTSSDNFFNRGFFQLKRLKLRCVLTVPQDTDISFVGTNLNMRAENAVLGDLNVKSANADVRFDSVSVKSIGVDSTNADLKIYDSTLGDCTFESVNLDFGSARSRYGLLALDSTNLDLNLTEVFSLDFTAKGTNADMDIERLTADSISVSATNFDARISVVGAEQEYTVESHGKNLPESRVGTDPNKKIYIKGTNCTVRLNFV